MEERRAFFTHECNGKRNEHRDEEHLEKLAGNKRSEEGARDDIEEEINGAERVGFVAITLAGRSGFCVDMKRLSRWRDAYAGLEEIDDDKVR
jgi:hypothetical protein